MADGLVTIAVELSDGSVVKGVANINKGMGNLEESGGRAGKSMTAFGLAAGTAMALAQKGLSAVTSSIGAAVSRFDTLENSKRTFANLNISASDTKKGMDKLNKSIDGLPTSLDSAVSGTTMLVSATKNMDKSVDLFQAVNDGVLGFGGSAENVDSMVVSLSKSMAAGKISGETLASMYDNKLGPIVGEVAKKMGMTQEQLSEAASKGKIDINKFQDALIDLDKNGSESLASLEQIAKDSTKGLSTSFNVMKTSIVRGLANMLKAVDDALKSAGLNNGIATVFIEMKQIIDKSFTAINAIIMKTLPPIIVAMKEVFDFVSANKDWLVPLTIGVGSAVFSLKLLIATMKTVKQTQELMLAFRGMQLGAKGAGDAFALLSREGGLVARSLSGVLQAKQLVPVLWGVARGSTAAQSALVMLAQHSTMAAGASKVMGAALAIPGWGWIAAAVIGVVSALTYFIAKTETGQKIWRAFTSWFTGVWDGMKSAVSAFADWFGGLWSSVVDVAKNVWNTFKESFAASWGASKSSIGSFTSWFSNAWGTMVEVAQNVWKVFSEVSSTLFGQAMSSVQSAVIPVATALGGLGGFIRSAADGFMNMISAVLPASAAFDSTKSPMENVVGLLTKFAPLIISIVLPISNVAKLLIQFAAALTETGNASDAIGLMADNFTGMITGVLGGLTTLVDVIADVLPQVIEAGTNILVSLIEGILSKLPDVIEAMVGVMTQLLETLVTAIAEKLPVLIESGVQIIEKLIEGITNALPKIIEAILLIVTSLLDTISNALPMIIGAGLLLITTLLQGITSSLGALVKVGIQIITTILEAIVNMLPTLIGAAIQIVLGLLNAIVTALPLLIEAGIMMITTLVDAAISLLPTVIDMAIEIVMALITALIDSLPLIIEAGINLIMALINAIITLIPVVIEAAIKIVIALVAGLIQALPALLMAAVQLIVALVGAIIQLVPLLLEAGVKIIWALIKGILSLLGALLSAAGQLIMGLIGAIVGFVGKLFSSGMQLIKSLVDGALAIRASIINTGIQLVTSLFNAIIGFVSNMLSAGGDLINGVVNGISGGIGGVVSTVSGGISDAVGAVGSFASDMFNAAADLAAGLVNGIKSKVGEVVDAAKNMAKGAVDGVKGFLGIHSPSRVFRDQVGKFIPEGLAVGIDRNARVAVSSMESLSEKISSIKPEPVFDMGATGGFTTAKSIVEHQLSRSASGTDARSGNVANMNITNYVQSNPSEAEQARLNKNMLRQAGYDYVY